MLSTCLHLSVTHFLYGFTVTGWTDLGHWWWDIWTRHRVFIGVLVSVSFVPAFASRVPCGPQRCAHCSGMPPLNWQYFDCHPSWEVVHPFSHILLHAIKVYSDVSSLCAGCSWHLRENLFCWFAFYVSFSHSYSCTCCGLFPALLLFWLYLLLPCYFSSTFLVGGSLESSYHLMCSSFTRKPRPLK